MKLITLKSSALAVIAAVFMLLPATSSHAAYVYRGTETDNNHQVVVFDDADQTAFWQLHSGLPGFTVAVSTANGSWFVRGIPNSAGELFLFWRHESGQQIAVWKYSASGSLLSAATFSVDTFFSWYVRLTKPLGDKLLIVFINFSDSKQAAAWLLGANGVVEKVLAWAAPSALGRGFHLEEFFFNNTPEPVQVDQSSGFSVNLLSDNVYTTYRFDLNGNWTAANSYPF